MGKRSLKKCKPFLWELTLPAPSVCMGQWWQGSLVRPPSWKTWSLSWGNIEEWPPPTRRQVLSRVVGLRRIEKLEGERDDQVYGTAWTKAQRWPKWATAQQTSWIVRPPCVLLWGLGLSQNKMEKKALISLLWPTEEVPGVTSDGIQLCFWPAVWSWRSHFTSLRLSFHTYSRLHCITQWRSELSEIQYIKI